MSDVITDTYTLDIAAFAHPCEVEFEFIPGDPGVHTYSNGDPGYPPTPAEYVLVSVKVPRHKLVKEDGRYVVNPQTLEYKTECVEMVDVIELISEELADEILGLVEDEHIERNKVEEDSYWAQVADEREERAYREVA